MHLLNQLTSVHGACAMRIEYYYRHIIVIQVRPFRITVNRRQHDHIMAKCGRSRSYYQSALNFWACLLAVGKSII